MTQGRNALLTARTPTRPTRALLAVAVSGAVILGGCSAGGDSNKTEAVAPAGKAGTPGPAAAPAPDPAAPAAESSTPGAPAAVAASATPSAPAPTAPAKSAAGAGATPKTATPAATPAGKTAAGTGGGSAAPSPTTPKPGSATGQAPSGGVEAGTGANATNPGATDVGVTGDSIKLGGIFMYGYALGNLAIQPMHREMQAIVKAVNDTGGLYGRRLNYVDCDDGAPDPARTKACFKKLVEDEKIFAGMGGATFDEAQYQKDQENAKVPWFAPVSLFREVWQNPYSFPIHMDMAQEAYGSAAWTLAVKHPKTYGVICLNAPEMLAACDIIDKQMAAAGVKQVYKRVFTPGTPDMSGDVIAARAANPDVIIHYTLDPTVTARFFIDAAQQNYWPSKGITGNHMALEILGGLIGEYPAKAQGGWDTNTTYKLWGSDYIAFQRKYAPNNKGLAHHVTQGQWFGANVLMQAMKEVGPNLTRDALIKVLNSRMWDTGPSLGQKFIWDPAKRYTAGAGNTHEYMYHYVNKNTYAEDDGTGNAKGLVLSEQGELNFAPAVDPHTGSGK
jgi:Periplasmic binding protein